ncbi:DEAD/DEAH box helicase [Alkalibacillus aidingensis]|uniref:DEAD/DEAH box helicase n=1 Tax=Alkalibacillus aidingensis TaxID=2747607 RepID=UPI0016601531|nr:SNF2 helicase associated domain-containing protein [Alkalibacillus aidingensis]
MLTKQTIKELFSNTVYLRGLRYYNLGKVKDLTYNHDEDCWYAHVIGSEFYSVRVEIEGKFLSYKCSCPAHSKYDQCKHSVAVLLSIINQGQRQDQTRPNRKETFSDKLDEFLNQQSINPRRDYSAELIDLFSNQPVSDSQSMNTGFEKETLQTEFTLKPYKQLVEGNLLSLEMKVGVGRTYVVKSLKKFLESIEQKSEHFFTPNFSYDPEQHDFTKDDQQIIDLLLDIYRNDVFYDNRWQTPPNAKGMTIPPLVVNHLLSRLAQHEQGITLDNNQMTFSEIIWHEEETPLEFSLSKLNQGYELTIEGFQHFNYFKNYGIVQHENHFNKLTDTQKYVIENLNNLLGRSEESTIPIKSDQMESFLSHVVPNLKEVGEISMSEQVAEDIINPALQATMHLDREDERLIANIRYAYNEIVIDPMKPEPATSNTNGILVRDVDKERHIMKAIEHALFKFNGDDLYLDDEEDIFLFLYELVPQLEEHMDIYLTQPVKNLLVDDLDYPTVQVDLDSSEDFLEVNFDLGDVDQNEVSQIIQSVMEKKRYYRLPNGAFIPLQDESLTQMSNLLEEMRLDPEEISEGTVHLPAYRGLQLEETVSHGLKAKYNEAFRQLIQDIKNPKAFETPLPEELNAELREYQNVGYQWMKSLSHYRFGGILADDMGLGKTLQTITFLLSERERNQEPALVVSPASLIYNWQAEFEKFAPTMNVKVISGTIAEREELFENIDDADVVVTSYPLIRQDVEKYRTLTFSTLILDEAQAIKNSATKQAQAIRAIRARKRFALSGTPIENSLDELWSIFDVILPGFFPSKKEFRNLPESQISKMSRPFILRRVKQDVLTELPDKIESVQHSELTTEQKQLYLGYLEKIQGEAANAISTEGFQRSRMKILAGLTRLRQLCCHPSLFIEDYQGESGKLNQLLDMVETARENGHRILIFSQFAEMLKIIRERLTATGKEVFYLDGQTPSKDRVAMVERFNQGEKDLFLISLKAGGTGLNLTGADTVILYDLWWNPAVEEQAAGRAHRMGQKKVVQVHRLITKGTIEEKIHSLQQRKRELIENVIQPGETTFQSLNEDDIRELLNV